MKKFLIELKIKTTQTVVYEVLAPSKKVLDEELKNFSPEDLGNCVEEREPEYYNEEIIEITEKKGV